MDHSIGIIGGADGPTAIFVTGNPIWLAVYAAIAIAAVWGIIRLVKKLRK